MNVTPSVSLGISLLAAIFLSGNPILAQVIERPVPDASATKPGSEILYQGSRKMRDLGEGRMVVTPPSFAKFADTSEAPVTILPALDSPALRQAVLARSQESGEAVQILPPVFPLEPDDQTGSEAGHNGPTEFVPPIRPVVRIQPIHWSDPWHGWPWAPIFGSSEYFPPAWLACQHRHRLGWQCHVYRLWWQ